MNTKAQKALIRREYLKRRASLESGYINSASADISARISELDEYLDTNIILLYYPINNEVDIRHLFRKAISDGKTVGFPKCIKGGKMDFYAVKSENELEPGLFGIPEPTEICPVITNPSGALCVTPAVVAGCDGRRLGYGGGYYDRFFAKFNVTVLCAIFEKQLVPAGNIPEGIYDVRFDILVTERSTIRP